VDTIREARVGLSGASVELGELMGNGSGPRCGDGDYLTLI